MILETKVKCPKCGMESPLKSFELTEEIMEVSRLAAKFGKNWVWVEEYLYCFRSEGQKPLRPSRVKIILTELLSFVDQKGFNIDRQWYTIRPDALFAAVRNVAQTNKTGFKNHNYLKKVAIDLNLKMIQREEGDVHKKERELMNRGNRDPQGPERIREIIGKI